MTTKQNRFVRPGVTEVYFLTTVADMSTGPTKAELEAGKNLSGFIRSISGFNTTVGRIPTPDLGSRHESSIPGNLETSESTIEFYEDLDSNELETTFKRDTEGYIAIYPRGQKEGDTSGFCYPVRVGSRSANITVSSSDPATFTVTFAVTGEPAEDLAVPTA